MAYCILRVAKIKSRVSLARATQHNTRERVPDNANPERTKGNVSLRDTQAAMARYTDLLPPKVRKNAVHAVELLVAVPPEVMKAVQNQTDYNRVIQYLVDSRDWLADRLGGPANMLNWSLHVDEASPHMHIVMMPLRDGKLSYNSYLGGSRDALVRLQTDFASEVGKKYGLERGRPRAATGRRHITMGRYYAIGQDAVAKELARQHWMAERAALAKKPKEQGYGR